VRLIGIAAVELLVIDGLDLLTALSTMLYLHSTTGLVHAESAARAHPNFSEECARRRWWGIALPARVPPPAQRI
jgi:hypothetical protein